MIQHFYDNNSSSLCCHPRDIKKRISKLTDEDVADIKALPSIAKYLKTSCGSPNKKDDGEHGDKKFKVHVVRLHGLYLSNNFDLISLVI